MRNRPDWRLTFENGDKHFKAGQRSIERFLKRPPYAAVVGKADPDAGHYEISAKGVRRVPSTVRLTLQDALANYRASLDQLVHGLVLAYDPAEITGCAFPIAAQEAHFYKFVKKGGLDKTGGLHKVRGVSPEAFACIDWLQPYQRGANYAEAPLFKLNVLRNVIHKELHVVRWRVTQARLRVGISSGPAPVIHRVQFASGPVQDYAQIASVDIEPIPGLQPEVEMTIEPPFTVIFDPSSPLGQTPVIDTLNEIRDFILGDVFPLLEPLV